MAFFALIYIAASLGALLLSWRAIFTSLVSVGAVFLINGFVLGPVFSYLGGASLRAAVVGLTEEGIRSFLASRFSNVGPWRTALATGVMFALVENIPAISPFFQGASYGFDVQSIGVAYRSIKYDTILFAAIVAQPFIRAAIHVLLVYIAIISINNRSYISWSGILFFHGALNYAVFSAISRSQYVASVFIMIAALLLLSTAALYQHKRFNKIKENINNKINYMSQN